MSSPLASDDLAPRGYIHVPIDVVDSVDTMKTFMEAEGCLSPGFATYGL